MMTGKLFNWFGKKKMVVLHVELFEMFIYEGCPTKS